MNRKPNVLLIILDTLRRDRLSIYGHHRETSSELDAFAEDATLFERAVATSQWTVPSHASMFTGLYASTHQVTQADARLSGSYPTLAEILQVAGYHTAAFCNNPLVGVLDHGLQRGFERFYNYAGAAPSRPFDSSSSRIRQAITARWGRVARAVSNQFARSDALFRMSLHPWLVPIWTRYINYKGHTQHSIDDAIAYIGRRRAEEPERPLFVFLNLMGTHFPYRPPQAYVDRIAPDISGDRQAYAFMRRFNADAARWASPPDPSLTEWERLALDGFYDAEIAYQDDHLGRLLDYLRESGALRDTLVIIAADHGEGHGDHDFVGHGFVVYQELVHVPLIVHFPERFPKSARISATVSTRRIFHTVLDIAEIRPPLDEADPNANVSGLSLVNATDGARDTEGNLAFAEAFPPTTFLGVLEHRNPAIIERLNLTQVRRAVYEGADKLAVVGERVEGLFDVSADPAEMHDLSARKPHLAADLHRKLGLFVSAAEQNRVGSAVFSPVSEKVVDQLRALGYIE